MVHTDLLIPTPSLAGDGVQLESLTSAVLDDYEQMLNGVEGRRLTGTHQTFARDDVVDWLETRSMAPLRADWAILQSDTGSFLGEVVLLDVDPDNRNAGFRIALAGPHVYGRGYGTVATRAVVEFAFSVLGLHRVHLEVYDFNARAIAAYRKCGFVEEGRLRDSLWWDDQWHDTIVMSRIATDPG